MLYTVRLQKGELWRPGSLEGAEPVSIRVAKGTGWVTFKCSHEDLIYRPGQVLELSQQEPLIQAMSEELDLEIEFLKRAKSFFGK